jgi:F-type H+-transporting ATPase subunit beta
LTVYRARKIEKFFSQPFSVAEQFTGMQWRYVKLSDTIAGFEKIMNGELDDIWEEYFMYKGTVQEVIEAAEKNK